MKVKFEKGYISVISPRITYLCGLFSGSPKLTRAAAFFPFIFYRSAEEIVPWIINHERIHFKQQIETVFVGSIVLMIFETLYARIILRKTFKEAYVWRSSEQEAYRNQQDQTYLHHRPIFAQFKYLKNRKIFTLDRSGEIIFASDPNTPTETRT